MNDCCGICSYFFGGNQTTGMSAEYTPIETSEPFSSTKIRQPDRPAYNYQSIIDEACSNFINTGGRNVRSDSLFTSDKIDDIRLKLKDGVINPTLSSSPPISYEVVNKSSQRHQKVPMTNSSRQSNTNGESATLVLKIYNNSSSIVSSEPRIKNPTLDKAALELLNHSKQLTDKTVDSNFSNSTQPYSAIVDFKPINSSSSSIGL